MKASGVMNGVRRHWTESSGLVLLDHQSSLVRKIVEMRKYFLHTKRGKTTLDEMEHEYAKTYGLLSFIIRFDWFTFTEL